MKVAFVGGGTMAEAILGGILGKKIARAQDITVGEIIADRRAYLTKKYGVSTMASNPEAADGADMVILAVKPQNLHDVFTELKGKLKPKQAIVSIVAGAKMKTLERGFGHKGIVRVMPNTPAQIGSGISVWTAASSVDKSKIEVTRKILGTLGEEAYVSEEKYIDMATALSASGPAYVFLFIESLIDAGVYLGMPRDMARTLVLQTVQGSAQLAKKTGKHPAELKDMVTSPGGTTAEALFELEEAGFRAAVLNAVAAAYQKAQLLGSQEDGDDES